MKKQLTAEHEAVLQRIQDSIPKELLEKVTKKVVLAPKNAQLLRDIAAGRDNPDIDMSLVTEKQREFAKAVIDSGQIAELEKEVDVEDKKITKQINDFVDNEIYKAVMRGELPKGKKFRNLSKKICKSQKKDETK